VTWAAFTTVAHFGERRAGIAHRRDIGEGAEVTTSSPQVFVDVVKHDNTLYAKIIKDANIRVEQ
jgi:hypothetical protein